MTKTKDQLKENTHLIRVEMDRLIREEGLSEKEALVKVLPKDGHRTRKLAVWVKRGLWPIPPDEQGSPQAARDAQENVSRPEPTGWRWTDYPDEVAIGAPQGAGELHTKSEVVEPSVGVCDARDAGDALQRDVELKVSGGPVEKEIVSLEVEDEHDAEEGDITESQRNGHDAGDARKSRLQEAVPVEFLGVTHEAHDACEGVGQAAQDVRDAGKEQPEEVKTVSLIDARDAQEAQKGEKAAVIEGAAREADDAQKPGEAEPVVLSEQVCRDAHAAQDIEKPEMFSMEALDARIRQIVKEVLSEQQEMRKMQVQQTAEVDEAMPPAPVTLKGRQGEKGRRENREYERFTFGIDKVLAARFVAEAKEKNLSAGKLLDVILWNRYGRPVLSYMEPGNSDSENSEE
jgi:hypothetical protein